MLTYQQVDMTRMYTLKQCVSSRCSPQMWLLHHCISKVFPSDNIQTLCEIWPVIRNSCLICRRVQKDWECYQYGFTCWCTTPSMVCHGLMTGGNIGVVSVLTNIVQYRHVGPFMWGCWGWKGFQGDGCVKKGGVWSCRFRDSVSGWGKWVFQWVNGLMRVKDILGGGGGRYQ